MPTTATESQVEPTLSEQLKAALAEVATMKEANATLTNANKTVGDSRDAAQAELQSVKATLETSQDALAKSETNLAAAQQQIAALGTAAESSAKKISELTTKLAATEKQLVSLDDRVAQKMAEVGCAPVASDNPTAGKSEATGSKAKSYTEQCVEAKNAQKAPPSAS